MWVSEPERCVVHGFEACMVSVFHGASGYGAAHVPVSSLGSVVFALALVFMIIFMYCYVLLCFVLICLYYAMFVKRFDQV